MRNKPTYEIKVLTYFSLVNNLEVYVFF